MNNLVLGTVQLGLPYGVNNAKGMPDKKEAFDILNLAYKSGITTIDTAEAYGKSHDVIGEFNRAVKNEFKVITKLNPDFHHVERLELRIDEILESLQVEKLEVAMIHSFKTYELYPGLMKALHLLKKKGKILKTGISIYSNREAHIVALDECIDMVQLPYNLLDSDSEKHDSLALLKANDKEVHIRSVYLQGLLFKTAISDEKNYFPLAKYIHDLHRICDDFNLEMRAFALQFALRNANIDKVLVGVEELWQMEQNIEAYNAQIPDEAWERLRKIQVREVELLNPANWK